MENALELLSLPDDVLLKIFVFVGPKYCGSVALVNSKCYSLAKDELLWKYFCVTDFHVLIEGERDYFASF